MCIRDRLDSVSEQVVITRNVDSEIELESFTGDRRGVHPMQFLNRVRDFNRFCNNNWEMKLLKVMKCFKGSPSIWAEVHKGDWLDFESFEGDFRSKYWSEEDQEVLRSKIMGSGNFGTNGNNVTIYVMKMYNEAKYLEPPLPLSLIHI